jgi:hypothetical protein
MNASARPEDLREMDHVQERRGNPGVDAVPQEPCPNEQTPPLSPPGPSVPDERDFANSVGGAGI